MRIVFVTPHPPSRAHARSLAFIVELAQRHAVTALALCRTSAEAVAVHQLRALGVETIAIRDGAPTDADAPQYDPTPQLRAALRRIVARGDVGLIQIEGARLAHVAQGMGLPVVWDVVGEEATLLRSRQANQRLLGANTLFASVIVGAERDAISLLGRGQGSANTPTTRVTGYRVGSEDIALRSFPPEWGDPKRRARRRPPLSPPAGRAASPHDIQVCVIPEAVDLTYYTPLPEEQGRLGLVVYGDLSDAATSEGIAWLLREVAPRIWRISPQVNLTIVGRGDSQLPLGAFEDVQAQLHDGRVRLVEGLGDPRAIIRQAALVIAPTPDGASGGAHESVLEAMALGTPVVVTQAGLSGLMAVPGRDLLVATSADRLATLTLRVLGDEELWGMLARHGRAYVERRHSWWLASQQLERLYARILEYPYVVASADATEITEAVPTGMANGVAAPEGAFDDAVSVMSMLGIVGLATHPLAGAPNTGRLAPRWR